MDQRFYIGEWQVEPALNRLVRAEQTHSLEPRLMRLLILLAENAGELVSKDEIFETVWGGLAVTDESLSQAISKLRKLLGDDRDLPVYIETIRKKGYRLLADVRPTGQTAATNKRRINTFLSATLVLGLVGAFYWASIRQEVSLDAEAMSSRPLTSNPGREKDPSISADGRFLVYSRQIEGVDHQLFLRGIDRGAQERQLTTVGDNQAPVFMPDGESIVFRRQRDGECRLAILSLIDGAERIIGSCKGSNYPDIAVSPSGRLVAYSAVPANGTANAIMVLDMETSAAQAVTAPPLAIWGDYDPVFAVDGESLYFARSVSEAMQDVYRVDLSKPGEEVRLTNDGRNIMGLTVSEETLLLSSNRDGRYGIWSLSDQDGALIKQPVSQAGIINPSVATESGRIVFEVINRVAALGRYPAGGKDSEHLLSFNAELLHPDVAPDDNRIVFSSNRSGFFEIWHAASNGTDLGRLTDFRSGFTAHPAYSPDGKFIAFDARPKGRSQLYIMDSNGGNLKVLTGTDVDRYTPSWNADGSALVFSRETGGSLELWQLHIATGEEKQLTHFGGYYGQLTIEGGLYYVRPNMAGIWYGKTAEAEPVRLVAGVEFSDWGNWAIKSGTLWYFDRKSRSVKSYNLKEGVETTNQVIEGYVPTADPAIAYAHHGPDVFATIRLRLESDIELAELRHGAKP